MASRGDIQKKCARLNEARNVRTVNRFGFQRFWEGAWGSFLLTGGTEAARADALCAKLCHEMRRGAGPTVVLTGSSLLEREMIARMGGGAGGYLLVSSPDYRNYHFFYRWSPENIARFLLQAAELLRCGDGEMPAYIHAFIDILSCCYEPSLASLSALAGYTDAQIAQIGQNRGASARSIDQIARCAQAGVQFRIVLRQVSGALLPMSDGECATEYNLSAAELKPDGVYLVNIRSQFPELVSAYFSQELQIALDCARPPRVVLDGLPLSEGDPLRRELRELRLRGVETGLSLPNAALLGEDGSGGFQSRMILLNGGLSGGDLEAVLRPLGTYTHYEPIESGGRPAKLFSLLTETSWSPSAEPGRLRVEPAETVGFDAVLYGAHRDTILLVRHMD